MSVGQVTPSIEVRRERFAAWCWLANAIYLLMHLPVVAAWPHAYDWAKNYISDLGVTTCGAFVENDETRAVCSPAHLLWNAGLALGAVLLAAGAAALWRSALPRTALALLIGTSASIILTAAVPWDVDPALHDVAATGQAFLQLAAMVVLAVSFTRQRWVAAAVVTILGAAISLFGTVALYSVERFGMDVGIAERIAFDTLTAWVVVMGALLLRRTSAGRPCRR